MSGTTGEPGSTATEETQVPGWFHGRRTRQSQGSAGASRRTRRKRPSIVIRTEEQDKKLSWRRKLVERLLSFVAMSYTISFLLHAIALILLSIVFVTQIGIGEFSTLASHAGDEDLSVEDGVDTRFELAGADLNAVEVPQLQKIDVSKDFLSERNVLNQLDSNIATAIGRGTGTEAGDGADLEFAIPKGGNAVSQGSFTAWTVPKDPNPGQNYKIVIQIKLPKKLRRYPRRDLSGQVVGTDRYYQEIPGRARGFTKVKDHVTQVVISVPGAAELVKDTIKVRSRMLKESQTLEIVF